MPLRSLDKTVSQPLHVALMPISLPPNRMRPCSKSYWPGLRQTASSRNSPASLERRIIEEFAGQAEALLHARHVECRIRIGDVLALARARSVRQDLITRRLSSRPGFAEQLKPMGRLVLPVGSEEQVLTVIDKDSAGRFAARQLIPVRFSRLEAA